MKNIKILSNKEKRHIIGGFVTVTSLANDTNQLPQEGLTGNFPATQLKNRTV